MKKRIISFVLLLTMLCSVLPTGVFVAEAATSYELLNPITGQVQGTGYDESAGHNGIDLYPYNYGDPIYAVASGTLMYSCERNHTRAIQSGDDCGSVKIILDEPITHNGVTYVCAFYTHMSELVYDVYCGYKDACVDEYNAGQRQGALATESVHVEAGDIIGYAGKGNGATHLHFSFEASEANGYDMMPNSEYFEVFGWDYGEKIVANEHVCDKTSSTYAASGLTLAQLQAKFPEGKYWNGGNADKYTSYACTCHNQGICINDIDPCNCNHFQGGTQCNGFARKIAYDAYGSHLSTWQTSTLTSYVESLKPGDVVYNRSPHWFMVISVSADSVTVGECNWGSRCVIKWSRTVKKSTIKGYSGLKIFIAPYSLTGGSAVVDTCTCSSSYAGTYTCITSSAPLLIRSGHGTNYGDVGSIPSGASVSVTKGNGSWAHVTYNGVSGYSSMEYLAKVKSTVGGYPLPFKTVPLATGETAARALYSDGTARGWIYGSDDCTIKEIYSSGLCLLNCEYNGTYQDLYAYTSDFLCSTTTPTQKVVEAYATTYYRSTGSDKRGWVDAGDKVYILGNSGTRTQIIYPHTDGTHRCAWVDTSAITHTHTPGTAATCTTSQICTTCDALLVNAYGHNPGAGATCTTSQTCARCGDVIVKALDHNPGATATCTTAQKCTRCGVTIVNAKGHTPGVAATCTTAQKCTVCNATITAAKGHTPGAAATCTTAQKCTVCNATLQAAKGHTPGAAATCTTAQKCTVCNATITAAKGHTPGATATCTTAQKCTVCNATLQAAKGHTPGAAATCTTAQKCTVCNATITAAKGHTPGAAATCTIAQKCTVCGEVITPAKGHSYTAGTRTDSAHPHKIYESCACGAERDSGRTGTVSSCSACNPPAITAKFALKSKPLGGGRIQVDVNLTENPGIAGLVFKLKFDNTKLRIVGVLDDGDGGVKGIYPGATLNIGQSGVDLAALDNLSYSFARTTNSKAVGTLVSVVFELLDGEWEETSLTFEVDSDGGITDQNMTLIGGVCDPLTVKHITYTSGDLNDDGKIDARDSVLIAQYLANWDIEVNIDAADCNGDGKLDARDSVLLAQYLANWDVTLGA